jgi:hypothetical protein
MILTLELRRDDGNGRDTIVAFVRIRGPDEAAEGADYDVGAVEGANPSSGVPAKSAGCVVVGRDCSEGPWALVERACAGLRKADFIDL